MHSKPTQTIVVCRICLAANEMRFLASRLRCFFIRHPNKKADSAKAHKKVVTGAVKTETMAFLNFFYKKYKELINKCEPKTNLNVLFPKSYKKATNYR